MLQVNRLEITSNKQLLAAAGNPHIRIFEVNSNAPQPVASYDGHTGNVTAVGFQKDSKWMFSGSEAGTVKIWDLRAPGFQREYASRGGVNSVVLHPNQGELISGVDVCMHMVCDRSWIASRAARTLQCCTQSKGKLSPGATRCTRQASYCCAAASHLQADELTPHGSARSMLPACRCHAFTVWLGDP